MNPLAELVKTALMLHPIFLFQVECTDTLLHGWAVGGGNFYLPLHSGISMNTPNDAKFLFIEIHYDNPGRRRDIVDSSGFRLYLTEELRQYDAGYLSMGLVPQIEYSQINLCQIRCICTLSCLIKTTR